MECQNVHCQLHIPSKQDVPLVRCGPAAAPARHARDLGYVAQECLVKLMDLQSLQIRTPDREHENDHRHFASSLQPAHGLRSQPAEPAAAAETCHARPSWLAQPPGRHHCCC